MEAKKTSGTQPNARCEKQRLIKYCYTQLLGKRATQIQKLNENSEIEKSEKRDLLKWLCRMEIHRDGLFEKWRTTMKTWNVLEAWYDKNGRRGGDKFIGTVKDDNEAGAIAKARRTYAVGDEIKVYAPTLKVGMKVKRTEFKSAKPFKITDTKPDGYILVPTPDDMRGTIAEAFRMYEHERHFERV